MNNSVVRIIIPKGSHSLGTEQEGEIKMNMYETTSKMQDKTSKVSIPYCKSVKFSFV